MSTIMTLSFFLSRSSGDYIETMLRLMGKESFAKRYDVFIDVGAGSYAKKETGGDISLSFMFDIAFPSQQKTIIAFEPFKYSYDLLLTKLTRHRETYHKNNKKNRMKYILKNMGVGMNSNDTMTFRGKRSYMTANKRIALHPWYEGKGISEINSTTIEDAVEETGADHVNILKTDTEGLEFEVLLGARHLLKQQKVDCIIYAYEDKWNWDSFAASYPVHTDGSFSFIKEQITFDTPNLQSVSMWLDSMGYKSYLIGKAPFKNSNDDEEKGFVAIPVTSEYWHDDFEVARNPRRFGLKNKLGNFPTWMDAIAVKENSSLHTWIEQQSASHGIRMSCS